MRSDPSAAFDTILLALTATLLSMVAVSLVQQREDALRHDVEQAGLAVFDLYASTAVAERPVAPSIARESAPTDLGVARSLETTSTPGTGEPVESRFEKPTRDPFWRAPWTSPGAEVRARVPESEPDEVGAEQVEVPDEERVHVAGSPRNRLAVMWGFGLLFLGTGGAVVAGWLVDRILVPPDFALVALIIGATFWSMAALSTEQ